MSSEQSQAAHTEPPSVERNPRLLLQDYFAHLCTRFILDCLQCSDDAPPKYRSVIRADRSKLLHSIAYTLWMANFDDRIIFGALLLLQRLRARLPFIDPGMVQFYREFGYAAFIGALMIVRKELFGEGEEMMVEDSVSMEDQDFPDEIWASITGGLLNFGEIQALEMDLRSADAGINGDTAIDAEELREFEATVRKAYGLVILPYRFPEDVDELQMDLNSLQIVES
ncbi:hypothetical protein H1R20_g10988, partial [Candolleomyces eurysporus]